MPQDQDARQLRNLPGLDIQSGLARVCGSRAAYVRMLRNFLDSAEKAVFRLQTTLERNEYVQSRAIAHSLKGAAGNIGATRLYNATLALEKALQDAAADAQEIAARSAELTMAWEELRYSVEQAGQLWRQELDAPSAQQTGQPDSGRIKEALAALRELLEESDTQSHTALKDLRCQMSGEMLAGAPGEQFRELEQQLNRYDFDAALETLDALEPGLLHSMERSDHVP